MEQVEVRRHAEREKPSERLTDRGRAEARQLGISLGPFTIVVASTRPRATETAAAMGYTVANTDGLWTYLGDGIRWPEPVSYYQSAFKATRAGALLGKRLLESVRRIAEGLPEGGRALVITHGGFPELLAAAVRPDDTTLSGEPSVDLLEGVRLDFEHGKVVGVTMLRRGGAQAETR